MSASNRFIVSCARYPRRFAALLADERGATAIEYALIAAGISVAIAATVFSLGSAVKQDLYDKVSDAFK